MADKEKKVDLYSGCFGPKMKTSDIQNFIIEAINDNWERDNHRFTLNIWGLPGSSKTSCIKQLEKKEVEYKGKKYSGIKVIDIPLAQIEEMGDVLGLPETYVEMEREVPDK